MRNIAEIIYSTPDKETHKDSKNNLIPFINYQIPAPERSLDMLLAKYYNRPYQSEVVMTPPDESSLPTLKQDLKDTTLMLITDGGLVPACNPDKIPSTNADRFGIYSIENVNSLDAGKYEISHQGYDTSFVTQNPNRLLPVDALRDMEHSHVIGRLYDSFVSTTGVMSSTENSMRLGKQIAEYISSLPVDAVLISSACGTSTRCGSYIGMEIEKSDIPVVQITNLTHIAFSTGIARVIKGNNICYPFGFPSMTPKCEYVHRRQLTLDAVRLLAKTP